MVGWALYHGHFAFATSLLVGFYGARNRVEISSKLRTAVIALGLTEAGKRAGVQESVSLGHDTVFRYVQHWTHLTSPPHKLCPSPPRWRKLFKLCVSSLQLESLELRPYSLRRGGATWWFSQHGNLDRVMILGRWQAQKTARLYLNESRAILAEMQLGPLEKLLAPYRTFFIYSNPRSFETLEPLQGNRPPSVKRGLGGLGRKRKNSKPLKKTSSEVKKKKAGVPQDPARVWGVAHLVGGGRLSGSAPFPVLWTREGGGQSNRLREYPFLFPTLYIIDKLAAERIRKQALLTLIYMW